MSYWGNLMAEQEQADALEHMGEAEWKDLTNSKFDEMQIKKK